MNTASISLGYLTGMQQTSPSPQHLLFLQSVFVLRPNSSLGVGSLKELCSLLFSITKPATVYA